MKRQLAITRERIPEAALVSGRTMTDAMGAAVYFLGVVRGREQEQVIQGIEYEAFEKMVEYQFGILFDELESRWPIESVHLIHRIGQVNVNEASVWVEIIAPHRGEAFAACQYLIDEMKQRVPIWKKIII